VLGAVEEERPAAQKPPEESGRHGETGHEAGAGRKEYESERRENRRREQHPLRPPRDAGPAEERRHRGGDASEAAQERHAPEGRRRRRHRAFPHRAVDPRERPEALADDDHAVGARHPAQAWERPRGVGPAEDGLVHPPIFGKAKAARQGPGGLVGCVSGPSRYQ
jgi:hypothetical protein